MEFVIWALVALFVLFTTLGVIVTLKTARAVRRGVERTSAQVRRTVEDTALKARTAQPGPLGEAARIRLELRTSLESTRVALTAGASDDPSLREAAVLLDQLQGHARQLDGELRLLMEREPDRDRVAARLPDARERASVLRKSADSLRFAAQDRARHWDEDGLAALRDQIEIESGALRGYREPPLPSAAGGQPAALHRPASEPAPPRLEEPHWPEPENSGSPASPEQHWSDAPTLPGVDRDGGPQNDR
ncbi:hypothetical protein N566_17105 [Streptomycetaceae bacterium MP113-05]|nr:hypothetical protein N566_17105 [Streptomycetaceae bacterium MP113-05]